jgi:hypothetical protein
MKKAILASVSMAAILVAAQANAADVYQAAGGGYKDAQAYASVTWTGVYAGINGGFGT